MLHASDASRAGSVRRVSRVDLAKTNLHGGCQPSAAGWVLMFGLAQRDCSSKVTGMGLPSALKNWTCPEFFPRIADGHRKGSTQQGQAFKSVLQA